VSSASSETVDPMASWSLSFRARSLSLRDPVVGPTGFPRRSRRLRHRNLRFPFSGGLGGLVGLEGLEGRLVVLGAGRVNRGSE
jgi:hypothetical protein